MNVLENGANEKGVPLGMRFSLKTFTHLLSWSLGVRSALLFLTVALPVAFYLRTYDSAMVKITLLQLGILAATAIWLIGSLENGRIELPECALPILGLTALLLSWNAIRFAFSDYRWAALEGFLRQEIFLLTIILAVFSFSKRDLRFAILAIFGGWSITVLYGLAQHLGLDPFIWKGAFGPKVFSTLGNPNLLASYLLFCAPLPLALALDESLSLWLRVVSGVISILGSAVLAWTGSTLEVALFTLSMAIFIGLAYRFLRGLRRKVALGLALACVAVCLAVCAQNRSVEGMGRYGLNYQSKFLPETWKGTMAMIKSSPMTGAGPGSFWVRYPTFRRPGVILIEHRHNVETDHPENEMLEQWADGGLIGLALWVGLFGLLLYRGWAALRRGSASENPGYALGIFAAVIGSVLSMMVSISSRFVAPGWLIYFVAGLLAVSGMNRSGDDVVLALPMPLGLPTRRALFVPVLAATAWFARYSLLIFQSDAHQNIAIYWAKKAEWAKALGEFDQEVPGAPIYIMGQYFKGNVLNDRNGPRDADLAVTQYRYVRSLAPNYVQVHYQEALALRKLGRKQEAIEELEAETAIDPVWDQPWHALSELYRETDQIQKAMAASEKEMAVKKQWENSNGVL